METSSTSTPDARNSCLKLLLSPQSSSSSQQNTSKDSIFVMGTWFPTHFSLSSTDGRDSWLCNAAEEDVRERASQWDQSVSEYIEFAERFLGFQQPGSLYNFADAGNGYRRLSFTFEKEGIQLEWRWRCKPSPDSKKTTADILDFLMDANIRLSEEVVRKTESFEKVKEQAEKCLAQSERLSTEREEFESEVYAKIVNVLNSKKAKLRELRDRLSKLESKGKLPQEQDVEEDASSEGTVAYHSGSDDMVVSEENSDEGETSKDSSPSKPHGRKRSTRN